VRVGEKTDFIKIISKNLSETSRKCTKISKLFNIVWTLYTQFLSYMNNIDHIRATCFGRDSAIIRPLQNIQGMTRAHSMGSHSVTLEITEYWCKNNCIKFNKNRNKKSVGYLHFSRLNRFNLEKWR
jgi:hypothetical protein